MLALIGFVIATSILIFVHEFGHYYVAKISGIKVKEFSVGFGKKLFSRTDSQGVEWKIRAIPLGGFVKMHGDQNPASIGVEEKLEDQLVSFYYQPWYIRFCVIAAGPIANYILAIAIFSAVYFWFGKVEIPAIVETVIHNSPAEKAGLVIGDKILQANNHKIDDFTALQQIIMMNPEQEISLLVERDREILNLSITPIVFTNTNSKVKTGYIGITSKRTEHRKNMNAVSSIMEATSDVFNISMLTIEALGQILVGKRTTDDIAGPLQIAKESAKSLSHGMLDFVLLIAMLSINLGLINLLPIPLLDGGHLMIIICELILQRPCSNRIQNILLKIGMIIITFLIVISVSNDIKSLIF